MSIELRPLFPLFFRCQFNPEDSYLTIDEIVELQVKVSMYQAKQGLRYSLVREGGSMEGEFLGP